MNNSIKSKEEYDKEPVFYCRHCLSLLIETIPNLNNSEYCGKCNSTNVGKCNIHEWEEMYKQRYGHYYSESQY